MLCNYVSEGINSQAKNRDDLLNFVNRIILFCQQATLKRLFYTLYRIHLLHLNKRCRFGCN